MTNLNVDEDKAKRLSVLANDTEKLQKVIETKEEELKKDKEKLRKYIEVYLPEAMMGIGMQEFTLVDGTQLTKSEKYYANISQINNAEAMSWLEENGFGPLIRESISANFGHTNEDKHFMMSRSGKNIGSSANCMGKYLLGDIDYTEEHTALNDALLECHIFREVFGRIDIRIINDFLNRIKTPHYTKIRDKRTVKEKLLDRGFDVETMERIQTEMF